MPVVLDGPAAAGWIALAVALHVLNQLARAQGWRTLVRLATGAELRAGHTGAVWIAGAGASGVVTARGGDALRLLLLARTIPQRAATLAGTLAAETVGETLLGLGIAAAALGLGLWSVPRPSMPGATVLLVLLALAVAVAALLRSSRRLGRLAADAWRGISAVGSPATYARRVLPWQVASRGLRAASIACYLVGFGLPAAAATVILIFAAQSGGRLIPFGPAGALAGGALVAAGCPVATDGAVAPAHLAGCFVAMTATLTVVGIVMSLACVMHLAGPCVLRLNSRKTVRQQPWLRRNGMR